MSPAAAAVEQNVLEKTEGRENRQGFKVEFQSKGISLANIFGWGKITFQQFHTHVLCHVCACGAKQMKFSACMLGLFATGMEQEESK